MEGKIVSLLAAGVVPFCYYNMKYVSNTARIPGKEVDEIRIHDHSKVHHSIILRQVISWTDLLTRRIQTG